MALRQDEILLSPLQGSCSHTLKPRAAPRSCENIICRHRTAKTTKTAKKNNCSSLRPLRSLRKLALLLRRRKRLGARRHDAAFISQVSEKRRHGAALQGALRALSQVSDFNERRRSRRKSFVVTAFATRLRCAWHFFHTSRACQEPLAGEPSRPPG